MYATITLEFFSDTKEHLKMLEQRLKHVHDVEVDLLVPRDTSAPTLIAISIKKLGEQAESATQGIAQALFGFLREDEAQKQVLLLTIEGDRVDLKNLSVEQIKEIILEAKENE